MNWNIALNPTSVASTLIGRANELRHPSARRTVEWLDGGSAKVVWTTDSKEEFLAVLAAIKLIPGREYIQAKKHWNVPANDKTYEILHALQFQQKSGALQLPNASEEPLEPLPWLDLPIAAHRLDPNLRPYQLDFIRAMRYWKGRGLCGDEMGTGKTCQAVSWARYQAATREDGKVRTVVVTLASTKIQWSREWKRWFGPSRVATLSGRSPKRLDPRVDAYVINWDILDSWREELVRWKPDYIIGDEAHLIGNPTAKRTKAFVKLAKAAPMFVALTGTPIRTRPAQFYTMLNLAAPEVFPDHRKFLYRYCDPKAGWGGTMEFKGATNTEELHRKIRNIMIRRLKCEVLSELPEKIRSVVPLPVSASYLAEENAALANLPGSAAAARHALENLSNSIFNEKAPAVLKWLGEFLESGRKLVVFAWHRAVVEYLMTELGAAAVRVDGSCGPEEKEAAKKAFVTKDSVRVFVANIIAGGTGIDGLQEVCSDVAFVELAWSPAEMNQAEDRLHRMGQQNPVTIHYLLGEATIEEDQLELLQSRWGAMGAILDGQAAATDLAQELLELRRRRGN